LFRFLPFILKYSFLALLYIFLLLVVRIIYRDINSFRERMPDTQKSHPAKKRLRHLIVVKGDLSKKSFPLSDNVYLGRSPQNDILIEDDFVSQNHAHIFEQSNVFFLKDLDSTNGTYLGNKKITRPTRLEQGDIIKIGKIIFRFE
jgi:hypothetical protein